MPKRLSAAFENRARAYERQSRIDEALADYASAISIRPQQPDASLGRGTLMLNRGAPERALHAGVVHNGTRRREE